MNAAPAVGPLLAVVLALLTASGALLVHLGGLPLSREITTAALRAAAQLAAVSLLITAVLRHAGWTALFVALMVAVAAATSARRVTGSLRATPWTALAITAGVAPVLALLLASTLVPPKPVAVLPLAGILIGGAMTATTLTGSRALDALRDRRGEYEAALALGLPSRDAALEVTRDAARLALVPALDQTRTVGLVTLPGAFVGVLLGGADPVQAGATQLLVLIGLLAAEPVAALLTLNLAATARLAGRDARAGNAAGGL